MKGYHPWKRPVGLCEVDQTPERSGAFYRYDPIEDAMRIVLADVNKDMCAAFERHCSDLPDVEIFQGSILEVDTVALVSPANSFGFMNGGIDAVYAKHFQAPIQTRLQQKIADQATWAGELPVGSAEWVSTLTDEEKAKGTKRPLSVLVAAPTMRVPTVLALNTVAPYLAARAALLLVRQKMESQSVAMPGMGTGIGGVDPDICAKQVRKAIECVVLDRLKFPSAIGMRYNIPINGTIPP